MNMSGSNEISAPREAVWTALFNPEVLKACIQGCEALEQVSDNEYTATVTIKIGPVKARFQGKVSIADATAGEQCRLVGEGSGGIAGFAKGSALVKLRDAPGGTVIDYEVESQIGGKLAQLGARMINSAAVRMASDFFTKFADVAETASAASR
ncbi:MULTISPECIES: carbon monoxide dehydrogenase subunit G [unclassified Chelatococcus]|uniref:SRPBCC family protein n=1 Tax=unclassified Chelatococcus TaxID=2638111 RepID=UPI001BCD8CC5|nr:MULTISPECIES: carbon monoxide dehydrogenase subunit G [unclassified Chelatococcus]MBS7700475.1 carbon monoxide dehydrogenase subunit G [Chelatococcus sp. YT9]MBX3556271.1 carbon monoxide dehydrogenase subunit G [Chelatococcus sp.]